MKNNFFFCGCKFLLGKVLTKYKRVEFRLERIKIEHSVPKNKPETSMERENEDHWFGLNDATSDSSDSEDES